MQSWKWYVYIIECIDGLYYTGMTWSIDNRLNQHNLGKGSKFTAKHGFHSLRYVEECNDITIARARERQLNDFSRVKKEALFNVYDKAYSNSSHSVRTIITQVD